MRAFSLYESNENENNRRILNSFRHLLSQETTASNVHRSLVAIKEHGILISIDNGRCQPFWVIG